MKKSLITKLLAVLVVTFALLSHAPATNNAVAAAPPGPCSPGGTCDRLYQSCRANGTAESTCRARRLSCWEYWGCA